MSEVKSKLVGIETRAESTSKVLDELKVGQKDVCDRISTVSIEMRDLLAAREERDKERADAILQREQERRDKDQAHKAKVIDRLLDPQTLMIVVVLTAGLLGINATQIMHIISPATTIAESISPATTPAATPEEP